MGNEYRAKVFKSGNSVALRLPKALGLKEGVEMVIREEDGHYVLEPAQKPERMIDLTGIFGAIPDLERPPFEEVERDWSPRDRRDG